jgi:7-keto-8-aminopelargonate synthetase-like enzyme
MCGHFQEYLQGELRKTRTEDGPKVLNFCANNYLGLCSEPRVMAAALSLTISGRPL